MLKWGVFMNIKEKCLPCMVEQAIKTANMVNAADRDVLYKKILAQMSEMDFSMSTPEVVGDSNEIIKAHVGCIDPYKEVKDRYNRMFLEKMPEYAKNISDFSDAVKYAIAANIIDFNPIHINVHEEMERVFSKISELTLTIDDRASLEADIKYAKTVLYLGDNCGEICFDKLLIEHIKRLNHNCCVYYAVRGAAVINDNTYEDALSVKMDDVATVISNGDHSPGTVLSRVSKEFLELFASADVVISKGQGNFETLEGCGREIYFMLMAKCPVVAEALSVPLRSLLCKKQ